MGASHRSVSLLASGICLMVVLGSCQYALPARPEGYPTVELSPKTTLPDSASPTSILKVTATQGISIIPKGTITLGPTSGTDLTVSPMATLTPRATATPTIDPLVNVAPERLEFTRKLLNAFTCSSGTVFSAIRNYLTQEQIIGYGESGTGLNIILCDDGSPAIALVNCNSTVTSAFTSMITEMEQYDPDYLEKLTNNGLVAFMTYRYNNSIGSVFNFNKEGIINWNLDSNKIVHPNNLKGTISTECFGIKMLTLGGDYSKYIGFMKQQLVSDCWWNLYKVTGDSYCYEMAKGMYLTTIILYNPAYAPLTFKDDLIQNLLNNVRTNNLASSFGGSWSEISANLVDRPDWTP